MLHYSSSYFHVPHETTKGQINKSTKIRSIVALNVLTGIIQLLQKLPVQNYRCLSMTIIIMKI